MKALILVLSARRDPWDKLMDCQLETWDAEDHPKTQTLFYIGKLDQSWPANVFASPALTESLEDVSPRTIEAFEKALELEWDYMARPHSSTYVHKRNLVKFCETLPRENVLCGIVTSGEKPFIWGGCHFLFSRDVIEKFVANKEKWNRNVMEDNSITEMAELLKIPVTGGCSATINMNDDGSYLCLTYGHGDNFTFTDFADMHKAEGHFFFRVKQDLRRHEDVRIMKELKKHLP